MTADTAAPATRIDKWLWAARAYKTRSMAAQACDGGRVTVNDVGAKPHKQVRPGDVVDFRNGPSARRWRVLAIAERRGPASVAQTLYEDLTPPPPPRPEAAQAGRFMEPPSRRPNKRERRQLDRLKRG